jgi:hypothetical protein
MHTSWFEHNAVLCLQVGGTYEGETLTAIASRIQSSL